MWTEGSRDRRKERLMTMEKKNLGLGNMNAIYLVVGLLDTGWDAFHESDRFHYH